VEWVTVTGQEWVQVKVLALALAKVLGSVQVTGDVLEGVLGCSLVR